MITVILPVRNGSQTLELALSSLFGQALLNLNCLVIDDGSTDSTPQLIKSWEQRWNKIQSIKTGGVGIAKALNQGLAHAKDPWIVRMDADDDCHPNRIQEQMATIKKDPLLALVGCTIESATRQFSGNNDGMNKHVDWTNRFFEHDDLAFELWVDSPLPHPSWMVRKDVFEDIGFYSEENDIPEDYEWLHRFFMYSRKGARLYAGKTQSKTPLLKWYDSETRLSRRHPAYSQTGFNKVKARYLKEWMKDLKKTEIDILGLGPKSKDFLEILQKEESSTFQKIRHLVDVNPNLAGTVYKNIPVISHSAWAKLPKINVGAIGALGTEDTRQSCHQFCLENGLKKNQDFILI